MKKDINYYMGLPYKIELHSVSPNEGGGFILEVPELGRLSTNAWGATLEEAYTMLEEIKRSNVEDMLAQRLEIPEPKERVYSGRINLRMGTSLHEALADLAEQENKSLNSTINDLLHQALGGEKALKAIAAAVLESIEVTHVHQHYLAKTPPQTAEKLTSSPP